MTNKKSLLLFLCIVPNFLLAQIVHDPKSYGQDTLQLEAIYEQYEVLYDQYETLEEQLVKLAEQYNAMTQINDFSDFMDFMDKYGDDLWIWLPEIEQISALIQDPTGYEFGDFVERIQKYEEKYDKPKQAEDFTPHNVESYSGQAQAGHASTVRESLVISDAALDRTIYIENILEEHHRAVGVNKDRVFTQKQAIDYGNSLKLQLAFLLNEMLKLYAQDLRLSSATANQTAQHNDFNAKFFNLQP